MIPHGFGWVWNEGNETAIFHVFKTDDDSQQLSVGVQRPPPAVHPDGESTIRNGRQFIVYDEGNQVRVSEYFGDDARVDVVSDSLDSDTLLRVAEAVSYQPPDVSAHLPS